MNALQRILRVFTPEDRRRLWFIVAGITLAALIDVIGIASVVPFLTLVSGSSAGAVKSSLLQLQSFLGVAEERTFIVIVGLLTLAVIIVSNILNAWVAWAQVSFTNMMGYSISRRLLHAYLSRDQVTLLDQNSSEMGKNVLSEVDRAVGGVLTPAITLFARSVAAFCIVAFLIVVQPLLAMLLALIFGGLYVLTYIVVKRHVIRIGEAAIAGNTARFKIVAEAFSTLRELRLYGRLGTFIRRFDHPARTYARANATSLIIGQAPRYILEPLAFIAVILLVLHAIGAGRDLNTVFPLIGLFAFAGYRLVPAFQISCVAISAFRFYMPALNAMLDGLEVPRERAVDSHRGHVPIIRFTGELTLKSVEFAYGDNPPILKNADLSIEANRTTGIIGRTGAGKTTLLCLILGLLEPTKGEILVDGVPLTGERLLGWQRRIGYVPQDIVLIDDTVAANIALGVPEHEIDHAAVERAARLANIHDFVASSLPAGYAAVVGERGARLSGGQRQRIGIARALYHDPDVIVFDEATSNLDRETEEALMAAIESLAGSRTLIIVAHRVATLRRADRVYVIEQGRISRSGSGDQLSALSESGDISLSPGVART